MSISCKTETHGPIYNTHIATRFLQSEHEEIYINMVNIFCGVSVDQLPMEVDKHNLT